MNGEQYTASQINEECVRMLSAQANDNLSDCLARPKVKRIAFAIMQELDEW